MEIGRKRVFLDSIDSTNSYAISLAEKGYPHGTIVVADKQTAGRGRHGRLWHSPPKKNIYMSIILRPHRGALRNLSLLTLMAAVAFSEAIKFKTSIPVRVKWPNDLMVFCGRDFKKVGGILSEARFIGGDLEFAIIGVGINVNSLDADFPPDLLNSAASLRMASAGDIDRDDLIEGLLVSLNKWYDTLLDGQDHLILKRWREISLTLGRDVAVTVREAHPEVIKGMAMDIDNEGRLLLSLPSGRIKRIESGDVVHLR
ncbi:MAG: biotin--[acetyl-CoA-carboxylase] ligase [Thermodesulfovibrionales bacterium]